MVNSIDLTLAALADPTRRQVIDLLREHPRRSGELAMAMGASNPAMSKHLRILRTSGLVEEERDERDSRVRLYRLRPEPFADLQTWLAEVQRFWNDQLEAFKAYAERAGEARLQTLQERNDEQR
jgi:DNA-binding transcriptional ArsR family regulator